MAGTVGQPQHVVPPLLGQITVPQSHLANNCVRDVRGRVGLFQPVLCDGQIDHERVHLAAEANVLGQLLVRAGHTFQQGKRSSNRCHKRNAPLSTRNDRHSADTAVRANRHHSAHIPPDIDGRHRRPLKDQYIGRPSLWPRFPPHCRRHVPRCCGQNNQRRPGILAGIAACTHIIWECNRMARPIGARGISNLDVPI